MKKEITILSYFDADDVSHLSFEMDNIWDYVRTLPGLFVFDRTSNTGQSIAQEWLPELATDTTFPWSIDNLASAYLLMIELEKMGTRHGRPFYCEIDDPEFIDALKALYDVGWPDQVGMDFKTMQYDREAACKRVAMEETATAADSAN